MGVHEGERYKVMLGIDIGTWVNIGVVACCIAAAVAVVLIMRGITGRW